MRIEELKGEHIRQIAEIERESFSLPWSEDAFASELTSPVAHYWTAVENGAVVGYIGLHVILDEGYITNVAVRKNDQRKGCGRALLSQAVAYCEKQHCAFLSLEVRKSNSPAIDLYESFGFAVAGVRRNYYALPTEDGLIMTLLLEKA